MRAMATKSMPKVEIKDGKVLTKGYGNIATSVIEDNTITRGAKLLYVYLVCKAGMFDHCYPKNSTIMESLGISRNTLRDYKDELIVKKLLSVEERTYKSGQKTSNNYYPTKMKRESEK